MFASALVLAAVVAPVAPDGADLLIGSVPAAGDVVVTAPDVIDLDFAAPVGSVNVRVLDTTGQVVEFGAIDGSGDGSGDGSDGGLPVDADIADGIVVVAWDAPEADARGAFRFTIDPTGDGTVVVDRAAVAATGSLRIARVLAAIVAGLAVLLAAAAVARASERRLFVAATVGSVASLAGLALAGVAADGGPADALAPSVWADGVRDGRLWLIPIAALAALVLASATRYGAQIGLVGAAVLGVSGAGWLAFSSAELDRSRESFSERLVDTSGTIELVVEPAAAGVNEVHLYGFGPGGSLLVLSDAKMWATNLDQNVGPLAVPVIRAGSNHFLSYSAVLPFAGRWELTVRGVTSDGESMSMATEVEL